METTLPSRNRRYVADSVSSKSAVNVAREPEGHVKWPHGGCKRNSRAAGGTAGGIWADARALSCPHSCPSQAARHAGVVPAAQIAHDTVAHACMCIGMHVAVRPPQSPSAMESLATQCLPGHQVLFGLEVKRNVCPPIQKV